MHLLDLVGVLVMIIFGLYTFGAITFDLAAMILLLNVSLVAVDIGKDVDEQGAHK